MISSLQFFGCTPKKLKSYGLNFQLIILSSDGFSRGDGLTKLNGDFIRIGIYIYTWFLNSFFKSSWDSFWSTSFFRRRSRRRGLSTPWRNTLWSTTCAHGRARLLTNARTWVRTCCFHTRRTTRHLQQTWRPSKHWRLILIAAPRSVWGCMVKGQTLQPPLILRLKALLIAKPARWCLERGIL